MGPAGGAAWPTGGAAGLAGGSEAYGPAHSATRIRAVISRTGSRTVDNSLTNMVIGSGPAIGWTDRLPRGIGFFYTLRQTLHCPIGPISLNLVLVPVPISPMAVTICLTGFQE